VVDLTPYKLETFLLLKSDGSSLYATKDVALAVKKFADFAIDRSVYITDNRQKFYFTQLFKVLELAGWKKNMVFLGYDFVTLPDGAMSSRKGNVVLFSDLFEDIKQSLDQETRPRHPDWTGERVDNTVEKLALAAIKFGILKHPSDKVIVFNKAEAISFEGFSGPYVLYAVARINSIVRKALGKGFSPSIETVSTLTHTTEKKLLLLMAGYSDMLQKTLAQHNPSVVAKYCFDLAQAFNDWYAQCEVVTESNANRTQARLMLAATVKMVLSKALACMGIETVEEM
jgi:arginyl-tRNA synthetase